ncbi:uncharacterized protein LOC126651147 [Myiozetetes cayanensis]|uniref:uncharacterized protein LOC126651147 n=1 Tax=Myiozetetes cayanensis TaxID=478635 RepID=UPI00215E56F0|nr:uncharacterized protein LOC126651147 [Myiozetetes cayanensis]
MGVSACPPLPNRAPVSGLTPRVPRGWAVSEGGTCPRPGKNSPGRGGRGAAGAAERERPGGSDRSSMEALGDTDTPTSDAPTSDTPTSDAPTSDTPTSGAPTSDTPTSGAPTSKTPTPGTLTPGTPTPSNPAPDAPTSDTPTSKTPTPGTPTPGTPQPHRHPIPGSLDPWHPHPR